MEASLVPPRPVAAVALDLDGTMLDTAGDIAAAVNATLIALELPALGEAVIRRLIGQGVTHLLRTALTHAAHGTAPDEALLVRAQGQFGDDYDRLFSQTTRFYPGALEGIDALGALGYPLACVTNKQERFTTPLLEAMGLAGRFALVIAGDTLPVRKPEPGQLLHTAQVLGVAPADLLVVGDSLHDLRAARAAGCPVFCVRYGYTEDPVGLVAQADAGLDRLDQIPALIVPAGRGTGFAPAPRSTSDSAPVP